MPRNRIVFARPPKRNRPKKPPAAAVTGPRIVSAQKPGLKRYTIQDAAEAPEASPEIKAFIARMMRPP